ncbi:hypothetical protein [Streptomyces sp. NPDC047706]
MRLARVGGAAELDVLLRLNDAQTVALRAAVASVPSHDVRVPTCPG